MYNPLISDFISECLVKDLDQRPFIREVLQHPLLATVYKFADKVILIILSILLY